IAANAGSVFELIVEDRSPPFPQPRRDFAQSEKRPADVPIDWQIRSSAASTFGHTAPTAAAADSQLCMLNWFTLLAMSCRSEEHTSELQSLMRLSYAVFC